MTSTISVESSIALIVSSGMIATLLVNECRGLMSSVCCLDRRFYYFIEVIGDE